MAEPVPRPDVHQRISVFELNRRFATVMIRGLVCALALAASSFAASGYGKTVYFSGYSWNVKIGSPPVGPGPNYFSDNANNVWVDTSNRLHLRIGKWVCAEVVLQSSPGYGTYRFYL